MADNHTVILKRDLGTSEFPFEVDLDGHYVGMLGAGKKLRIATTEGEHSLSISMMGHYGGCLSFHTAKGQDTTKIVCLKLSKTNWHLYVVRSISAKGAWIASLILWLMCWVLALIFTGKGEEFVNLTVILFLTGCVALPVSLISFLVVAFKKKRKVGKRSRLEKPDLEKDDMDLAMTEIFKSGEVSASILQQRLKWGYAKSAKVIDDLEKIGAVGPFLATMPREILAVSYEHYQALRKRNAENEPKHIETPVTPVKTILILPAGTEFELQRIDGMDGHEFEEWCAGLLRKLYFRNVVVTPASGDQGVDIIAEKDGLRYAIQCKCYSSPLGNTPVQEVAAGMRFYKCHVGVVLTNNHFTKGAIQLADEIQVVLWDREWIQGKLEAVARMTSREG